MTYREILDVESTNENRIILLKQGAFFRAYERSAFYFHSEVKKFKLMQIFPKNLKGESLVYLGFRSSSLEKLMGQRKPILTLPDRVEYATAYFYSEQAFRHWKESIPLYETEPELPSLFFGPPPVAFERSHERYSSPFSHEHLPVFREYIRLNEEFDRDRAMDSVPRNIRYALVDKLREDLFQLEILIYQIYDTIDLDEKLLYFRQAAVCCLDIRGRFRALNRRGLLGDARFTRYFDLSDKVAAQFRQWQNSTLKKKASFGE